MAFIDRRLLARARPIRVAIASDAVIGVLAALLVLAQAVLIAVVAARAFGGATLPALSGLIWLLAGVAVARAVADWGFEVTGRLAAAGVGSRLRLDVVEHRLLGLPADQARPEAPSAELATAAVEGLDALQALFSRYLPDVVLAMLVPIAVLVVVAFVDPTSAVIMVLTLPLIPVFMWLIGRQTERRTRARMQSLSLLANHFLDVVRGLPTLRAFNRGEAQVARIEAVSEEYRLATMGTLRLAFLSGAVLEFAATIGIALVAVTVGVRLVEGGIGFQPALIVLILAPELYLPLRNLAAQFHASADGTAAAARLLDIVEAPATVPARESLVAPSPASAAVRFDNVSFTRPGRPQPVLSKVDLELRPGEIVALVGRTGSGKTTLASLLLRLAEPVEGRVTVGAADLAGCDALAWRSNIAWTPQRPTLFRATLEANIWFSDAPVDTERVRQAAADAAAAGFIEELPDGYGTVVGDGGRTLSAGQRQRVALARAFCRDSPLMILDEPTANLDGASAEQVAASIERLRRGRTTLLIVHREELARIADRVIRLEDDGRLTETVAMKGTQ